MTHFVFWIMTVLMLAGYLASGHYLASARSMRGFVGWLASCFVFFCTLIVLFLYAVAVEAWR